MRTDARPSLAAPLRIPLLAGVLAASLAAVFSTQLLTGFGSLTGDRLDGLIQISILEHWVRVLHGAEAWDTTAYFAPYRGTLAYNDGYLLYGLVYSVPRAFGADPFVSAELVNVVLRVTGFAGAFGFARTGLRLPFGWAATGACLFTVGFSATQQSAHAQILSVALGPVAALLLVCFARRLEAGRRRSALAYGVALVLLEAAWLMTAFYMAWMLGFFALVLGAAACLANPPARRHWLGVARREWPVLLAVAAAGSVAEVPFLQLYLPKARESGMHGFAEVRFYLPRALDTFRLAPGNFLFGWTGRLLAHLGGTVATRERLVGWPPVHIACFLAAAWLLRRRPAVRPALLAIAAVWLLTLEIGAASGWWLVFEAVPGARAIRVVSRMWIVLAGPVLCVVLLWLREVGASRPGLAVALAALLVAEQLGSVADVAQIDRARELRQLALTLPPPAGCRAFAVLSARAEDPDPDEALQTLSANANAMLLAEVAGLLTVNGVSTFNPPDAAALDPTRPDYLARIGSYVRAHRLEDVCGVDLRTGRWAGTLDAVVPLHVVPTERLLATGDGGAGGALLGGEWSAPHPWGRWSGPRATLRFLTRDDAGPLRLSAWAVVFPTAPTTTQRVAVLSQGRTLATWTVSAVPTRYEVVLPAPAPGDPYEATLLNLDMDAVPATEGPDRMPVGLGLVAVRLDRP